MKLFLFQLVATPLPSSPATQTQLFASPEGMLFHESLRYKSKMYTKKYIYLQMVVTLFKSILFSSDHKRTRENHHSRETNDLYHGR